MLSIYNFTTQMRLRRFCFCGRHMLGKKNMEEPMKSFTKVLFVFIALSLVFSFNVSGTLYAKDTAKESKVKEKPCPHEGFYFCPKEGCKYKSDKPGKCPKCGVELKKHEHKVFYVCPMKQCNVKADKPGKCPKCGMELKKKTICTCKDKTKCKEAHKHDHKVKHDHDH